MTREDPLLLPICQSCGKYKGIGTCKNPECPESTNKSEKVTHPCIICGNQSVVSCSQCGEGYCQTHSIGFDLSQLCDFYQRLGTCVHCKKIVCEKCWILNPNGDIICLTHLEEERKPREFH